MNTTAKDNKKIDEFINQLEIRSRLQENEYTVEKSYSRLMSRITAYDQSNKIFFRRIFWYRLSLVAASVALFMVVSGLLYTLHVAKIPDMIIACNNTSSIKCIFLPDGTVVKLNNQSKLTYPEEFDNNKREVFLDGEAYFNVAHDKKHPFIVRTGELDIRVLGTKFTVNASSMISQITATLIEGSIDVSNKKEHVLMKPGQQMIYDVDKSKILLSNLENANREIRWIDNVWVLTNTPLLDVCQRLERKFNVKFVITSPHLIDKSFTGEFYTNESLESILETMKVSASFSYERNGNRVILK